MEWTEVVNGIADVAGVPEGLIDLFSKRSKEIRGRLDEVTERINEDRMRLGLDPVEAHSQEALDIAARETRAAKLQHVATGEFRADWDAQATCGGYDVERLADVLHATDMAPPVEPDADLQPRVSAALTEQASTFGHRDAVQQLSADARQGIPVSEALDRASALLAWAEVVPVVGALRDQDVIRRTDGTVAPVPTGERRWSTHDMLAVEARLVADAVERCAERTAVVPSAILHETVRDGLARLPTLGTDQVEMALCLASSGAGVECVEAGRMLANELRRLSLVPIAHMLA